MQRNQESEHNPYYRHTITNSNKSNISCARPCNSMWHRKANETIDFKEKIKLRKKLRENGKSNERQITASHAKKVFEEWEWQMQ